jgi:hypothetical protein
VKPQVTVESGEYSNGPHTVEIVEHENYYYPTTGVVEKENPTNHVNTGYTTQTMLDYWGPGRKISSWVTTYTYYTTQATVEGDVEGVTGTPYTYHYDTITVYAPTGFTVENFEAQTQYTPSTYTGRIVVLPTTAKTTGTPRTVVNPTWVPTEYTGQVVIAETNIDTTTQTETEINTQNKNNENNENSWTSSNENSNGATVPSNTNTATSQPGCASKAQVNLSPDESKYGSSSFSYKASNGDVVYDYQYIYNSVGETVSEEDVISYDYSYVDQKVNSSFSSVRSFTEGDETIIQGCSGWWDQENIELTNPNCEDADWFLQNCVVTDPLTKAQYDASEVNFSTLRGQTLLYSNWICSSGNSQWQFNLEQCQWVNLQGTQSLVEVRNLHKASSLNKPQLTLAF